MHGTKNLNQIKLLYSDVSVGDIFQRSARKRNTAKQADLSQECINRSQIHECRNWERGRAVSILGIFLSKFWYSVARIYVHINYIVQITIHRSVAQPQRYSIWRGISSFPPVYCAVCAHLRGDGAINKYVKIISYVFRL